MIGSKLTKVASLVIALVLCVALLPATAVAASSTCQAYNPQLCSVTTTTPSTTVPSSSTLPFTGLDVALLVAGGVVLMGAGVVVRMASRRMNN